MLRLKKHRILEQVKCLLFCNGNSSRKLHYTLEYRLPNAFLQFLSLHIPLDCWYWPWTNILETESVKTNVLYLEGGKIYIPFRAYTPVPPFLPAIEIHLKIVFWNRYSCPILLCSIALPHRQIFWLSRFFKLREREKVAGSRIWWVQKLSHLLACVFSKNCRISGTGWAGVSSRWIWHSPGYKFCACLWRTASWRRLNSSKYKCRLTFWPCGVYSLCTTTSWSKRHSQC
jgi:hypothetical protein